MAFQLFSLAIKCDSNPCHENAICEDTATSYACSCRPGFTGDGHVCQGMRILEWFPSWSDYHTLLQFICNT